jgi:nucleoside 2-deoxyribosyltransferase
MMNKRVYLGTSLHNRIQALSLIEKLTQLNIGLTYNWCVHGQVNDDEELTKIGLAEMNGVKDCDVFFMVQPGRNGTHVELGIALALDKPIVILTEPDVLVEQKSFYLIPGIVHVTSEAEALAAIVSLLKKGDQ